MLEIVCPRCGGEFGAINIDHRWRLVAGTETLKCEEIIEWRAAGKDVDDIISCSALAEALAAAVAAAVTPPTAAWPPDESGRRDAARWTPFDAKLVMDGTEFDCMILDISPDGARLSSDGAAGIEDETTVDLKLDGYGLISADVIWRSTGGPGLRFRHDGASRRTLLGWLNGIRNAQSIFDQD